jgi:hypothetical protein
MLGRFACVYVLSFALTLSAPHTTAVRAQELSPDRPSVSTSAKTIPRGLLQIEAGASTRTSVAESHPERRLDTEILLRVGLTDRLEFRFGVDRQRGSDFGRRPATMA